MDVKKFCYTAYLAAYMSGEGVKVVDRNVEQMKDEDGDLLVVVAASAALGVHDYKSGVPPKSCEEVKAEVTRLTGII